MEIYKKIHTLCLVGVGKPTHSAHDAENIVVSGVYGDAGGVFPADGVVAEDELESGIVDARHIARATGLVLLRPEGERVDVNSRVRGTGVVLVWLHCVEVCPLTLREAVLPVELELGGHDRVLPPAVKVESSLREHEGTRV